MLYLTFKKKKARKKMPSTGIDSLKEWFLLEKRSFPWREEYSTPYAVWVSEVMLQQTRASVVIAYFKRWMQRFPTLESLAVAPLEEVLKMWEGLGYYSRARNLRQGAIQILEEGGSFPNSLEKLLKIKGIGPYTAGAILSFAFHQKSPAIDGNVARVVSRYKGVFGDLTTSKAKKRLEEETLSLLPEIEPWIIMEALIELGATFCLPNPNCSKCPLQSNCYSFAYEVTDQIPLKKKRQETLFLQNQVAVIFFGSDVLVEIKEEGKVLGGLAEFPSFPYLADQNIEEEVLKRLGLEVDWQEDLSSQKQSFTRYQVDLYPSILRAKEKKNVLGCLWVCLDCLVEEFTFSSGHKKVLSQLAEFSFENSRT